MFSRNEQPALMLLKSSRPTQDKFKVSGEGDRFIRRVRYVILPSVNRVVLL